MAPFATTVRHSNETAGITTQPYPLTNIDPSAGSEYNAATVSGIVFGIFMALLALYSIWQYGRQYTGRSPPQLQVVRGLTCIPTQVFMPHLQQQHRNDGDHPENLDIEIGTLSSINSE
jgi:hypothetical protein